MKITELKHFYCFHNERSVKVLRHKETKFDLWEKRGEDKFQEYQNKQGWDVFGSARFIISFIAEQNSYAKFVGVWEVISKRKKRPRGFRYKTKELKGFEDLKGRMVVNWGKGTRSWAQWLHRQGNKEIVELLPHNYVTEFPDYYNITLPYDELKRIVDNPDSHREWQRMLSSVSGVYLILDKGTGRQYVGSASGRGGIWKRWKDYSRSPSGGNVQLKDLLKDKPRRHRKFQFSILRVLEPHSTKDEVIAQEVIAKQKLGSIAKGLNSN